MFTNYKQSHAGNALVYVLIGVILFGALSYILTRQEGTNTGAAQQISEEKAKIIATDMINHATAVKFAVQQMLNTGSTIDDIDFVRPGGTGYDTAPHQHKVFHPGGGGVTPMIMKPEHYHENGYNRGWRAAKNQNIEWTQTSQSDINYNFTDINPAICTAINKKITGESTIYTSSLNLSATFVDGHASPEDLSTANCANCEGHFSLCVYNSAGGSTAFYTIIAAR